MYKQSFHMTEEDMGPMFMDNLDEEQTLVKTTPSADEIEAQCCQLEALMIPGFSQKLFADTASQTPPILEPQVIIKLIMTASAAPGLDASILSSVASVTQ